MSSRIRVVFFLTVMAAALGIARTAAYAAARPMATPSLVVRALALPGAPASGVYMDYIAYDPAHHRVWVPAGNTGRVDVVDVTNDKITEVDAFPTAEVERGGTKRTVGPSSATVGPGFVYVGNRADSKVCAIDSASLAKGACIKLDSMPDGLAYVAATRELWVTTPRDNSLTILDASAAGALTAKATITLDGQPEGFAVDEARRIFYTNLEDKDRTLSIDIRSRTVTKTWMPGCGKEGPRGLALDQEHAFLMVACPGRVIVLDAGHDGKLLSSVDTGEEVDNIDFVASRHELYAAAGGAANLTVAHLDAQGKLTPTATVATAPGARNAVATDEGTVYVTDSRGGKLLVARPAGAK